MKEDLTLPEIALFVIEIMCMDDTKVKDLEQFRDTLYRYAHVGSGHCGNKHEDWEKELRENYNAILKYEKKI